MDSKATSARKTIFGVTNAIHNMTPDTTDGDLQYLWAVDGEYKLIVRYAGENKTVYANLHSWDKVPMRLRTALVTARGAPAHERAHRALMDWNIHVDEAMFLGGLDKGPFLGAFEPDFFFDDQTRHVQSASLHAPAGHVPHGVANE